MRIFETHYSNGYGHRYEITPAVGGRSVYCRITKDGGLDLIGEATVIDGDSDSGMVGVSETEALVAALENASSWEEK